MERDKIFKDLKVVELASVLAGPLVGSFFSELGAEVIKIENIKTKGDPTRQWKTNEESKDLSYSSYYTSANFRKKSLFLDLKNSDDYSTIIDLIKKADILITNLQEHKLVELGFDYTKTKEVNRNLIYAQLNAYERNDKRLGYDMVMQAETGLISMTGHPSMNAKIPVPIVDILASHQMKEAILIALLRRQIEKTGSKIDVSLFKSGISALSYQASNYLLNGSIAQPMGTEHPNIAPYGDIYESKDKKKFMLTIGSDQQFEMFRKLFIFDEQFGFSNNQSRLKNRELLNSKLKSIFDKLNMDIIANRLSKNSIPFCFIHNIKESLENRLAKEMISSEIIDDKYRVDQLSSIAFSID